MQISGGCVLPMARAQLWLALNDVDVLRVCLPGCERLSRRSQADEGVDVYDASLVVKIGPIKARFDGQVDIRESNGRDRLVLDGSVQGGLAGFARGQNAIELIALDDQATELRYVIGVEMGGRVASLGAKAVEPVVRRQADLFFEKLVVAARPKDVQVEANPADAASPRAPTATEQAAGPPPADWMRWVQRERREGLVIGFWLGAATVGAALSLAGALAR